MAKVSFQGDPVYTCGRLPAVGDSAPDFLLTKSDLSDVSLKEFSGKKKILNIVPSLDTPVCAASAKKFNEIADTLPETVIITVSVDTPFAQDRFSNAEGVKKEVILSQFRNRDFGRDYGVEITDSPLRGLFARAIVVLDEKNKVLYTEMVPDIGQEPDYDKAVGAIKKGS
jgi:thiol peroxidase